jgi:hypothetical protein
LSSQPPPEQEITDWFSHPVTELFYRNIDQALVDCHEDKRNAFIPSDPNGTQERQSWLLGAEWAFGTIKDMQEDKQIGEVEDVESVGS